MEEGDFGDSKAAREIWGLEQHVCDMLGPHLEKQGELCRVMGSEKGGQCERVRRETSVIIIIIEETEERLCAGGFGWATATCLTVVSGLARGSRVRNFTRCKPADPSNLNRVARPTGKRNRQTLFIAN